MIARRLHLVAAMTAALLAASLIGLPQTAAARGPGAAVTNTVPPSIIGVPEFGMALKADPGVWEPEGVAFSYQWFRDGNPIQSATAKKFRPRLNDIGSRLIVEVTGSLDGAEPVTAVSAEQRISKGTLSPDKPPRILGARRYLHVLRATPGTWSRKPDRVKYHWSRGDARIKGAAGPKHFLALNDFGRRLQVEVTVSKEGFRPTTISSKRTKKIGHRVPARRVVRYHVETRGNISANLAAFRKAAQQTYNDPRGWRASGVKFKPVRSGGRFTLVLSEASRVPGFSSGCSSEWSCRVGNFVIINQTRWQHASPMWNEIGRSLRDYRHMVVNHETGHWLGHGHRYCTGPGNLAPVMQQQSKGLDGCRANPWPTPGERRTPRFG